MSRTLDVYSSKNRKRSVYPSDASTNARETKIKHLRIDVGSPEDAETDCFWRAFTNTVPQVKLENKKEGENIENKETLFRLTRAPCSFFMF